MYPLAKVKLNIVKLVNQALGKKLVRTNDLIIPPKPEFGDLSLPCFIIAKKFSKTSVEMAEILVRKVKLNEYIVAVKAIGPYLNFTFNKIVLAKDVIEQINKMKENYGKNKMGQEIRVMIEYSNANTHKAYHVGHLRNLCLGDALTKILSANGFQVISASYINDFGIHVAKTLWAYQTFFKKEKLAKDKGEILGSVYLKAVEELEKDPAAQEKVRLIMNQLEKKQEPVFSLWQKTRQWSLNQFKKIYQEMRIKFIHTFYESQYIGKGLDLVAKLYKKRFLIKSQGAILADLSQYNLGVLLFLRQDGTALYPVADLPLAIEKFKKFKLDKSIYLVDVRQSLYFKQLFKILELLGYISTKHNANKKEMVHLAYEFVKLPSGIIQSRTGKIVTYQGLRQAIVEKAVREIKSRHKKWPVEKVKKVAGKIVNGAIKFEMIKVSADKIITFDINQALQFQGFTAAYLQYTYARINSIIKKSEVRSKKLEIGNWKFGNLIEPKENELIMKLARYPEVVELAGKNYDPSEIAKYLFDLAQEFNEYYHAVPVLKAKTEVRQARLALVSSINQVIANGLGLLGIEVVGEM